MASAGSRTGSSGSAARSSSARRPTDGLPAADPAAAAATALGLDDHVAELAGVPLPAAQQPAVGDDAATDADLAEDHQDVLAVGVAGCGLGDRGQVALVVDGDRVRRAEALAQQVADRDVAPAEVGAEGEHVAVAVDQAGDADGEADRRRSRGGPGRPRSRWTSSASRSSTSSAETAWASRASLCSLTTAPPRSRARVETWLTLISAPRPQTPLAVELDGGAGSAHRRRARCPPVRTRPRSARSPTRVGDRGAGQPELGGEAWPASAGPGRAAGAGRGPGWSAAASAGRRSTGRPCRCVRTRSTPYRRCERRHLLCQVGAQSRRR